MKNSKENKRCKGITLIALVVTIVVLLILAGVSISMLTGNNGIITQAQNAKKETEEAEEKEKIQLAVLDAISKNNDLTEENLQKEIDDEFGSGETKVYENGDEDFSVIFQNKDTNYRIEDGEVTKIDIAFKIKNKGDLQEFKEEVNGGNSFKDQYVYLLKDIDLENEEWGVIGSYTDDSTNKPFAGIFEGNNNTISNININKSGEENIGLFSYNLGTIRDLKIEGGSITGLARVGGIVSINKGTIENCHNNGTTITIASTSGGGGITASNRGGIIIYCSNKSNIIASQAGYVGGIAGGVQKNSEISNCFNIGNIEGGYNVGGIAGSTEENTQIKCCYNAGNIVGTDVRESEGNTNTGGIVGLLRGNINSCYNAGTINGISSIGGIVGQTGVSTDTNDIEISNCYNVGKVENQGWADIGNIIGGAYGNRKIILKNNYFSREISNIDGVGAIGENAQIEVNETIAKDLNYMKTNNFVKDLNKDEEVYTLGNNLNEGYPVLKWQTE